MRSFSIDQPELLTLDLAATTARSKRHGSPFEGASLAAATELRGKPVREAVAALASRMCPKNLEDVFLQTFPVRPELERNLDSLPMRSAWNLVSICLTARSSSQCLPRCGIIIRKMRKCQGSATVSVAPSRRPADWRRNRTEISFR
jgi:hypothetical protein